MLGLDLTVEGSVSDAHDCHPLLPVDPVLSERTEGVFVQPGLFSEVILGSGFLLSQPFLQLDLGGSLAEAVNSLEVVPETAFKVGFVGVANVTAALEKLRNCYKLETILLHKISYF